MPAGDSIDEQGCSPAARAGQTARTRGHRFTLLEAVAAGALLGMCLALLHTSVLAVQRLHRDLVSQNQAISVLDNVVERLAAQPDYTAEQVQQVLTLEFARSALAAGAAAQPTCTRKGQTVALAIAGKRGKPLAQVVVPLRP